MVHDCKLTRPRVTVLFAFTQLIASFKVMWTIHDEQFPMVCALLMQDQQTQAAWEATCTGTLITPNKLVTAAHCATSGATHVSCAPLFSGKFPTYKIQGFLTMAYWNQSEVGSDTRQDVAVLTLHDPIEGIRMATLPSLEYLYDLKYNYGEAKRAGGS